MMAKKKLYVGCGLTLAPQEFKDMVERTKEILGDDWEVMHFLGTTAGDEKQVYEVDIINNVRGCDAFVGIMDEPSWGLGWESREAVLQGKPVLLVAHIDAKVTRLALGAPHYEPVTFKRYNDMLQDVPGMVREEFSAVLSS